MLEDIAHAWATGEPTIQSADRIDRMNPCPTDLSVRASTPLRNTCSSTTRRARLPPSTCWLAPMRGHVDVSLFSHAVRLSTLMLDISVNVA